MMNRRTFLLGTAGLGGALALTACGRGATPSAGGDATIDADTEANLTLFYWDKAQTPTIDENLKAFNAVYPNIAVTTSLAAYDDYWTKLRTQAEGDQLPDVFWMNGPNIQLYASNGMLAPLDEVDVDWASYPEALVDLYTVDGTHYGVPKDYDTIACWINKAAFDDAGIEVPTDGWTWEEHHAAAKAIADKGTYHGALAGVAGGQETYYNAIAQAGGYVIRDGTSGYDDPKSMAGIQYLADMIADGSVPSLQVMSDTFPHELFLSGKGGILWGGSWQAAPIREAFPDRSQIVAVPLPRGEQQACVIHGLSYVASASSAQPAAARALVQFMTSQEANQTEARNGTAIPAFTGTQAAWVEQAPEYNLDVFIEAAEEYAVPYPASKNTSAWNAIEPEYLNSAFSGEASVEEACTSLADEMNDLLAAE
jgi:multiple sugar transport system substrate-binding protein